MRNKIDMKKIMFNDRYGAAAVSLIESLIRERRQRK